MNEIGSPGVRRILLATDFSQWTARAVEFTFDLARCFNAEVYMVHGIEPIADAAVDKEAEDGDFDEFFGELVEKSRQQLEDLVEAAEEQGVTARFHIEIGERWRIITDHAEEEDVDMIILGRRAYKDHQDVSLGTTSQRVYFGSNRPVLTVPSVEGEDAPGESTGGEEST